MPANFDRGTALGTLLGPTQEKKIVIPKFQRSFSWEKAHISTFATDIIDFHKDHGADITQKYFFGPVVVSDLPDQVTLLDGQQRLATATILLSVLRQLCRKYNPPGTNRGNDLARDIHSNFIEKENTGFTIQMNQLDHEFFRRNIQVEPEGNPPPPPIEPKIWSHKLILQAKTDLTQAVEDEITRRVIAGAAVIDFIRNLRNTLVNRVTVAAIEVANEEDASRIFETLNDRGLRLSVPDLLLNYLIGKAGDEARQRTLRDTWDDVIETIGNHDIERFLRHMWVSKYGDLKEHGLYRDIRKYVETHGLDPVAFADDCLKEAELYVALVECNAAKIPPDALLLLTYLIKKLGVHNSLPLLLSGRHHLNDDDFRKLVKASLDLYVRYSLAANLNPGKLESTYYAAAKEIRKNAAVAGQVSGNHVHKAKDILKAIDPTNDKVVTGAKDLDLQGQTAGYVIRTLAHKIQNGGDEIGLQKATIEHIFPKNPSPDWNAVADEAGPYTFNIGNLTLLGERINRESRNAGYPRKKVKFGESLILMTRNIPTDHPHWNKAEILTRGARLAAMFPDLWPSL